MNDRTPQHPSPTEAKSTDALTALDAARHDRALWLERSSREFGAICLSLVLVLAACWVPLALIYRLQYSLRTQTWEIGFAPTSVGTVNRIVFFGLLTLAAAGLVAALLAKTLRTMLGMCPRGPVLQQLRTTTLDELEELTRHDAMDRDPSLVHTRAEEHLANRRLTAPRVHAVGASLGHSAPPV